MLRFPDGSAPAPAGSVYHYPVELVDLFPTVAAAAGLAAPAFPLPGVNLLPALAANVSAKAAAQSIISRCSNCSLAYRSAGDEFGCDVDAAADAGRWFVPCCTTLNFDYIGMSIRTLDWRFSLYCRFNSSALAPVWTACTNRELFRQSSSVAFDPDNNYENLAGDPAHAKQAASLEALLRSLFVWGAEDSRATETLK